MTDSWDHMLLTGVILMLITYSSANDANDTDAQRMNGPIISPYKSELILKKGQNYSISCKGRSEVQFRQQEIPEELTGPFSIITKNRAIDDGEYKFETTLELYNIDQFAIGYYACYDDMVQDDVLNELTEEPNNTEHVTYIYIYVDGTDSLFAPMREVFTPRGQWYIIECRPTTPDIKVTLNSDIAETNKDRRFSPKIGFVITSNILLNDSLTLASCEFQSRNDINEKHFFIRKRIPPPPTPSIKGGEPNFLPGETFTINCTLKYESTDLVDLVWESPPNAEVFIDTNAHDVLYGQLYSNIVVRNATKNHAGVYKCISKNNCSNQTKTFEKKLVEKPYLTVLLYASSDENRQAVLTVTINMVSYPPATYKFTRNNKEIPRKSDKYDVYITKISGDIKLKIKNSDVTDTGYYIFTATNGYLTKVIRIYLKRPDKPRIVFKTDASKVPLNGSISLTCNAIGYPLPNITWKFKSSEMETSLNGTWKNVSDYEVTGQLTIKDLRNPGNITCSARNKEGLATNPMTRQILLYELDGFGIKNTDQTWFSQNDNVIIRCIAFKYDFTNVTWSREDVDLNLTGASIEYYTNEMSHVAKLVIPNISLYQSGTYVCRGTTNLGEVEEENITISVTAQKPVEILEPAKDTSIEIKSRDPVVQLTCEADGVPPPKIQWSKDGKELKDDSKNKKIEILTSVVDKTHVNSTLVIKWPTENDKGAYECKADSRIGRDSKLFTVSFEVTGAKNLKTILSVIIAIILVLIVLVVYLAYKIRKEKQFRRELQAAGLLYFNEGVTKSINPELGIDEQAELLPYDEKFEFPPEKLVFGKQLGAGAFGVVYKAEARGIINAEETTEVAVKMVKKNADNMFIKALASELKIMVHMGKHVNIVNLLGACTKNVGKRELLVIVEYCKFGNIHKYMQRHREVFIDQLTDNKEQNLGRVNRGFSSSSASTGVHSADYFASCTQNTDHTFVNSANTNQTRSTRKVSEGYVQPEWRSNYESDYSFDGRNPRPLTSRDLLVWAFQIARGMEYLASRKVLHGDLAARNVLLAEDNIVKICDFGLARSIYKNDEYQKKEHELLPVKWLALECMTDRIFSTQSDVWAFGIVLWELFSLAQTPYPNVTPASLIQWLADGNRLHKPPYADDRLHNLMLKCWQQKPTARPSFTELQETIGSFLEDNVRNHYVDLNSVYMSMNAKPGEEDYLAMMCAPDYNNLVTPSPHHYVNERSFFPTTPPRIDDEGYLQMSPMKQNIFSPRTPDTKFDFDIRKLHPRDSEASSCGSESTPMLTLSNLPARSGSESDHEGSASPNLKVCPRIEEETDDVFETKQNNAKNVQNSAVTNPTYITLDVDIEKKPKDIISNNTYLNVPNGLVK